MSELKLYIFGSPHLERQGKPISLNLRKAMALLVYLAVSQEAYSRDTLAKLFWTEHDQSSARASLRRTLYTISAERFFKICTPIRLLDLIQYII